MNINLERPGWMYRGECRNHPTNLFFPERGEDTAAGKAICKTCPVRAECLTYAIQNGERYGIWGGYSERERRKMRQRYTERRLAG